ncbi:MAG: DUF1573 domain-containing protein [Bacteroidales bacterium]|nr:DUF1573 domain-containing protein [Bacteroidales bacterium]MCF8405672.1 DUF1573 domain-containing protein [Bacteroidales bacterium]
MKRTILSIAFLIFAAMAVNAQVSTDQPSKQITPEQKRQLDEQNKRTMEQGQPDNPNAPVITFDKLTHDYGDIEQHGDGKCEFKFINEGKEPLILSNVRSSCGCTIPEWPRQPILPGKSEVIKVKYDTKRVGMINKTISVYSNAKASPITLRIKGKVLAKSATAMPEKNTDEDSSPVNK